MKQRSAIRRHESVLSADTVRTVIRGHTRGAGVRANERPLAAKPSAQEHTRYGLDVCSRQREPGTKLLDDLKGLVSSFPQDKSKQIIAALNEIFSELDGGAADSAHRGA